MRRFLICSALLVSLACGGNSSSSEVAGKCQKPRTGTDPTTGKAYLDRQGSAADEKEWLRRWIDELYLWYREVPKVNAASFTVLQYFDQLKTPAKTPSAKPKDRFHFTLDTAQWNALSQSGVDVGYGVQWVLVARSPPRKALAAYVDPGSPALKAGITRGTEVMAVDGEPVLDGDPKKLNAGLFPVAAGETHVFSLIDRGGTTPHDVPMKSEAFASPPVQHAGLIAGHPTVGYMQFNSFDFVAEKALSEAIAALRLAGAKDLVLDLRYNGGGLVAVAAELGYMLASPARTNNKIFEKIAFNDKSTDKDPVTGRVLLPEPFLSTAQNFSLPSGQALPHLDLDRLFVLTGSGTASASESVINALIGVDMPVMLFGATTTGKPYGFYPTDNCGTTYFSIQFEGQNAKGFGEYSDGFTPGGGGPAGPPGCVVADDFTRDLGDPAEGRLAAALGYRANQTCPSVPVSREGVAALREDFYLGDNPFRQNRIYLRPR